MFNLGRRQILKGLTFAAAAGPGAWQVKPRGLSDLKQRRGAGPCKLALEDYEPRSMLHVPETKVLRARFPAIDFHTHLSAQEIVENRRFANLVDVWLEGDHYKWRAMRTNGVAEIGRIVPFLQTI